MVCLASDDRTMNIELLSDCGFAADCVLVGDIFIAFFLRLFLVQVF